MPLFEWVYAVEIKLFMILMGSSRKFDSMTQKRLNGEIHNLESLLFSRKAWISMPLNVL